MAIASPDSTSASASAIRKSSSSIPSVRCRIAVAAVRANVTARPSTGSPRVTPARCQSAIARQVRDHVADARAAHGRLRAAHEVEVDHERDRHLDAVGPLAPRLLERRDRGGDAVVGEARRHRDERQPAERGSQLGEVERAPAADPDQRVVEAGAEPLGERVGLVHAAGVEPPEARVDQFRAQRLGDLLAQARSDDDRDVAAGGDSPVGQQRRELAHGPRTDVDEQRRADHARQQRHATSRARARSAWSSTSTHSTAPIGATPIRPPRSANS